MCGARQTHTHTTYVRLECDTGPGCFSILLFASLYYCIYTNTREHADLYLFMCDGCVLYSQRLVAHFAMLLPLCCSVQHSDDSISLVYGCMYLRFVFSLFYMIMIFVNICDGLYCRSRCASVPTFFDDGDTQLLCRTHFVICLICVIQHGSVNARAYCVCV